METKVGNNEELPQIDLFLDLGIGILCVMYWVAHACCPKPDLDKPTLVLCWSDTQGPLDID